MNRSSITLIFILLALFVPASVLAQDYTCTQSATANGFTLACKSAKTATPTPTPKATATATKTPTLAPTATATNSPTPQPTRTATPTNTPTVAPTATPVPPTPTTLPTLAPTPVTPVTNAILNVPLLDVGAGSPMLDANNRAIIWAGQVGANTVYFDARIVGARDGVRIRVQTIDQRVSSADTVTIILNGRAFQATWPVTSGWEIGERCGPSHDDCRGWTAQFVPPLDWAALGGAPRSGEVWPLSILVTGESGASATWVGSVRWGVPDYAGVQPTSDATRVTTTGIDAMLGGAFDCGAPAYPDYFTKWGALNWAGSSQVNVQAQWDIADWPCYSKVATKWTLAGIPPNATIISATLTYEQFGNAGYNYGDTLTTTLQAFEVSPLWDPATITWNNAPPPGENLSWLDVPEVPAACEFNCVPPLARTMDVTELTRRALAKGQGEAAAIIYTAAGQYHSGKYLWAIPVVSIWYTTTTTETPVWTPTPSQTPLPTALPTTTASPIPTSTAIPPTPTRTPTAAPTATASSTPLPSPTQVPTTGSFYYVSPNGLDSNPGAIVAPWATFNRAWQTLKPGDTLIVMDGTYYQTLQPNVRNGEPGKPITIKAMHDGQVIIDGQGVRNPVKIGDAWPGPIGEWFVIEGIVAKNSNESVWFLRGDHNVLRRVSGYNANTDTNDHVFLIWANDNVVEDCLAAGTGRNLMLIYQGSRNTIRRCYTRWDDWRGGQFCGVTWPNGNNVVIYNASDNRVENVIADGRSPGRGILIQANADTVQANNNQVLGSISVLAGMDTATGVRRWPSPRPANNCGGTYLDPYRADLRAGLAVWGQGAISGNVWRDVLATVNAGLGFSSAKPFGIGVTDGLIDHATIVGNGLDAIADDGGKGANVKAAQLTPWTITNSKIGGTAYQGEGARLSSRYIDGVLTSDPLWPWPMDARAQAELGINITAAMQPYLGAK
jgi:hypothetical protein